MAHALIAAVKADDGGERIALAEGLEALVARLEGPAASRLADALFAARRQTPADVNGSRLAGVAVRLDGPAASRLADALLAAFAKADADERFPLAWALAQVAGRREGPSPRLADALLAAFAKADADERKRLAEAMTRCDPGWRGRPPPGWPTPCSPPSPGPTAMNAPGWRGPWPG